MAWFKTGGGGALSETVLWTNSSPTTSFAAKTVTLSQSIANFERVRIYWRGSTSLATEASIDVSISDLQSFTGNSALRGSLGIINTNGSNYTRSFAYVNNTSIAFTNAYPFDNTSAVNIVAIPTKICGLK